MPRGSKNSSRGRSQTSKAKHLANLFYGMRWSDPVMISDGFGKLRKTPNAQRSAMPLSGKLNAGFNVGALAGCVTLSHAAVGQSKSWIHYWRTNRARNAQRPMPEGRVLATWHRLLADGTSARGRCHKPEI